MKNAKLFVWFGIGVAVLCFAGGLVVKLHLWHIGKEVLPGANGTDQSAPSKPVPQASPAPAHASAVAKLPDVNVGDPLEKVLRLYGPQSEIITSDIYSWDLPNCTMIVRFDSSKRIVEVDMTGSQIATPDGIVLGRDTLAQFREKLGDRVVADREDFEQTPDIKMWHLTEEVRSSADPSLRIAYGWFLDGRIEEQARILSKQNPPTPNVFRDVPVHGYSVDLRDAEPAE